ncbi:MAG: ABC transporter substrate-binding protein [Bacillota bacterium]|nr:ABC transporter substrate-binding protein [Bacillota bacterium]
MKKIISILLVFILMLGVLVACGSSSKDNTANSTASTSPAASVGKAVDTGSYPLTLTDSTGAQVTINKKPTAIVSLTLAVDEILYNMADKSSIKGLTYFCDDPGVSNIAQEAKNFPTKVHADNAESIIALQPDLVIIDSWAKKEFVQQLRDAGIPVYQYQAPDTIDKEKQLVTDIANLIGEKNRGSEIVNSMDQKLKEISDKLGALKPDEKLTVLDYSEMGSTSGKNTNFDDIVTRAGLINAAAKAGLEGWPQISKEEIVKLNPDVIVVPAWIYDKNKSTQSIIDSLKNDKALAGVNAVKNNRIIAPNYAHMSSTSQYAVNAVDDVAKAVYPELFK